MDKKTYIQANKDWLAEKSKEEGVHALAKGVFYKALIPQHYNLTLFISS